MARARAFSILGVICLLCGCGSSAPSGSMTGSGGHGGTGAGGGSGIGGGAGTTGAGGAAGAVGANGGVAGTSSGGAAGSSGPTGGAGGATGGATGAGGANGGAGGTASGGGGGSTAAGGAGGSQGSKVGMITATQTFSGSSVSASAVATFTQMTAMNPCLPTTTGNCRLYACPTPGTPSPKTHFSAGTVAITGLAMPIALSYAAGPQMYTTDAITGALWTASRPAMATVSGSTDVPAVTLSVTAPNPITPVTPAGPPYSISKSADLQVTWTGGVEGTVTLSLSSGSGATLVSLECDAAASGGTMAVPASLLSQLGTSGGFSVAVANKATQMVGDWQMQFEASSVVQQTAMFTN